MNYYDMLLARKLAKGELPPNAYLLKTASGSLVSFDDGADLPIPSFICNITAQQDLHGYDGPWVGGAGKNKLPMTVDGIKAANTGGTWSGNSYAINGVTFTVLTDSDGNVTGIKVNGTNSGSTYIQFIIRMSCPIGSYILNGCPSDGGAYTYFLQARSYTPDFDVKDYGNGVTMTVAENLPSLDVRIIVMGNASLVNKMFYPMIRLATETDPTFAPYSNICPISGHTEVNAWVRGKNLLPNNLASSVTLDGITATKDDDGVITLTGQGNGSINPFFYLIGEAGIYPLLLKAGQYTLNQGVVLPTNSMLRVATNNGTVAQCQGVGSASFMLTDDTYVNVYMRVDKNADFTTPVKVYPLICITSDTEYEPYNPQSQTIQVSWQTEAGEVFGGYVDLVSGVLTVTHKSQTGFTRGSQDSSNKLYSIGTISDMKAYTTASAISPYFIDSMFEKMSLQSARIAETPSIAQHNAVLYVGGYIGKEAELDTLLESLQVKYELETPIVIQLDGNQIKSLLGKNNAWCDTGDVTLEYFGKGDA